MSSDKLDKMRSDAQRYREMAENASDPEVAETLIQIATDLEATIIVLEKDRPRSGGLQFGSSQDQRSSANAS